MPIPEGMKQLNLVITEAEDRYLENLRSLYDDAGKYWLALQFFRYGMRHARKAIVDGAKRKTLTFPPEEEDLP